MGFFKKLTKKTFHAAADAAKEVIQERREEYREEMRERSEAVEDILSSVKFGAHLTMSVGELLMPPVVHEAGKVVRTIVTITRTM